MSANFRFSGLHHLLSELNILVRTSNHNQDFFEGLGRGANREIALKHPKQIEAMRDCIDTAKSLVASSKTYLAHLKCNHIDDAAKRLLYWAEHEPQTWLELNVRSRALRDAIDTELRSYYFYQYPKQNGEKLLAWKEDWAVACAAFPSIPVDVYCATDLYALGHNTASVFHSMRIVEYGLRAIAKERQIVLSKNKPIEWATWQEIIRALDEQIKAIGLKPAGQVKDNALEFYSGARADLNGFKDEYRNQVSHLRAIYDEFQALRALTNVNHFMNRLGAKIDQTQSPIDWGF